jgi:hypothetical protein
LTGRNIHEVRAEAELSNGVRHMASTFAQSTSRTEQMLAYLAQQNLEMSRNVAKLHVMVGTFATALARSGAIDEEAWRAALREIETAFARIDPAPPPAPTPSPAAGGSPYRDGARGAPREEEKPKPRTACASCKANVEVESTHMTELGAQCDTCFRKEELRRLEHESR